MKSKFMQNITYSKLKNGLTIGTDYVASLETVTIMAIFRVGSRNENHTNHGISHFIEHMLFKGTRNMTARQLSEAVDMTGGIMNAFTSKEFTAYYIKCLKKDMEFAIKTLCDMILNSIFPSEEMILEKSVVCQEILSSKDSPDSMVFDYFLENFFPTSQLGQTILGTEKSVNSITQDMCINYMKKKYTPANLIFSACGNIEHSQFERLVEKYYTHSESELNIENELIEYGFGDKIYTNESLEQIQFLMGFPTFSIHDDRCYTLSMLTNILGEGMSSRLFQKIREELGLVYTISVFTESHVDCGGFLIYAGTDKEKLPLMRQEIKNELEKISTEAILSREYEKTINQTKAGILMSLESSSARAQKVGFNYLQYERYIYPEEILEKLNAVTAKDIQELARTTFSQDSTCVMYGNLKF